MEKSMKKIDLLDMILNIVCPIVQLTCMIFVVFICENAIIDTFLVCLQLSLLIVQLFLPKLLRRFVMKKHTKELIEKIEDDVNLYL
jgi:ABC-type transport system involved in cytochrome bd biosynthesis fused ATPase/permease subunit